MSDRSTLIDGSPRGKYAKPIEQLQNRTDFVSVDEWFERHLDRTGDCWVWTRSTCGNGYGKMSLPGNKRIMTHRFAYQKYIGPIPEGMLVCHKCDNKPCCNPAHLFLGTYLDNNRDTIAKGRWKIGNHSGEHNGGCKLKREQVLEIRASNLPIEALMEQYGMSESQLWKIRSGYSWRNI